MGLKMEVDELTVNVEALTKSKMAFEKQARNLEDTISDYKTKNESLEVQVAEVNNDCAKMSSELNDLRRQIEEKEALNAQMLRNKNSMTQTNDELKRHLEEETKTKMS